MALQATGGRQNRNFKTSALRSKPVPVRRGKKRVKRGQASSRLRKAMICSAACLLPENLNPGVRKGLIEISYQPCYTLNMLSAGAFGVTTWRTQS